MRKSISAIFVAALVVAACGGSDDDGASTPSDSPTTAETGAAPATAATEPAPSDVEASVDESVTATSTSDTAPTDDEALLKQAVEEYVGAFGNGEPDTAVALLSERCADTVPVAQYRAAVASAGEMYPGLVVDEFIDIVLDDDRAVVFYSTDPVLEVGDGERWIVESAAWAWDDC